MLEHYKTVLTFLILGVISLIAFLSCGLSGNYDLFSRGGSIVALFAVAAEFRLSQVQSERVNEKVKGLGGLSGPVIQDLDAPGPFKKLRTCSHVLVVLGTLIWGFGDLALKLIFENA